MYTRYAEAGARGRDAHANENDAAATRRSRSEVKGQGVYSRLKFESGVHRVQRVPVTEANGRIHTSTVTVAVLPEAEEVEVQIDPQELRDHRAARQRSGRAGRQHHRLRRAHHCTSRRA